MAGLSWRQSRLGGSSAIHSFEMDPQERRRLRVHRNSKRAGPGRMGSGNRQERGAGLGNLDSRSQRFGERPAAAGGRNHPAPDERVRRGGRAEGAQNSPPPPPRPPPPPPPPPHPPGVCMRPSLLKLA